MPQLPELEGREFVSPIKVKVETRLATPEETKEILRSRIEEIRERATGGVGFNSPLLKIKIVESLS